MKYTVKKQTGKVVVTFKVTAEEWAAETEAAYQKNKNKYNIQGFRKGHAPRKVLEKMYGEGLFVEDAFQNCVPKYYEEFLDKNTSVEPVDRPEIDVVSLDEKGLVFTATVTVKPEVELGEYKGLTIKRNPVEVTSEEIDAEVNAAAEKNARFIEVSDRAAKSGDEVVIDYSGSVDGVKFDGGTAEKQNLELGSKSFIPGFEEQVVGMNVGEEKDISVKFPEDYHAENLKGKDAVFHIVLHEIKKKELPEITDEFVKDADGAESVEAFKAETRKRMQESNDRRAQRELEDNIVKTITDKAETEIPDALVESQIDRMVQEMEYRLMYQGLRLEDYLKYSKMSLEAYRKGYEPQAREIVKQQLVIDKIISDEKIEAGEEELEKKIAENAAAQNKSAEEYKKENESRMDYLKNEIVIEKLFDFLKNANTIE